MLTGLSIQNFVLIDSLSIAFHGGLAVITGETGAGKSILLDSLDLVLGGRGSPSLIRTGADKAMIVATFDDKAATLAALGEEYGLTLDDEEIRLKRILSADGKSRAFVNDQPVGLPVLKAFGEQLVELSGQFEHHLLLNPGHHLALLDAYGQLSPQLEKIRAAHHTWQQLAADAQALSEKLKASRAQEAFLKHALEEFNDLDPQAGEEAELSARRGLLMHTEKIREALVQALHALEDENGALDCLNTARSTLERAPAAAASSFDAALKGLDSAALEATEAVNALHHLAASLDADPEALREVEDRLFKLRDLARKHGVGVDELSPLAEKFRTDLNDLTHGEDRLDELNRQVINARETYIQQAQALTKSRTTVAQKLQQQIGQELPPLKLGEAELKIDILPLEESQWSGLGQDRIVFSARMNAGIGFGPIHKVASGGELARLLLAFKVVLAQTLAVPCVIFDEVDSGVGGATADAVGERLKRLAGRAQVIVVTHSPQVAARADHHYLVEKSQTDGITRTTLAHLSASQRQEEIARMLSGASITTEARQAAQSLMAANG